MSAFTFSVQPGTPPDVVPPAVADFVTPAAWREIVGRAGKARDEANCVACGIECCCCLWTGFFCIFCCHPLIANACHDNYLGDQARIVNYTHYGGAQVVRYIAVKSDSMSKITIVIVTLVLT